MKNNFLPIILFLLVSCSKNEKANQSDDWKVVEINSDIQNNINLKKLNNEKEFSILFDSATLKNKTNNIIFLQNEKINLKDTVNKKNEMFTRNRICSANYWKSDTLTINVMNSDGFTGDGFSISLFKNKYKINYSSFSDAGPSKYKSPNLKFIFNKLVLNKRKYKENDSIFGYVEFKCKDEKTYPKPVEYFAKGYFKTKIEKY